MPNCLSQLVSKRGYKTLGTGVIFNPISYSFLKYETMSLSAYEIKIGNLCITLK